MISKSLLQAIVILSALFGCIYKRHLGRPTVPDPITKVLRCRQLTTTWDDGESSHISTHKMHCSRYLATGIVLLELDLPVPGEKQSQRRFAMASGRNRHLFPNLPGRGGLTDANTESKRRIAVASMSFVNLPLLDLTPTVDQPIRLADSSKRRIAEAFDGNRKPACLGLTLGFMPSSQWVSALCENKVSLCLRRLFRTCPSRT